MIKVIKVVNGLICVIISNGTLFICGCIISDNQITYQGEYINGNKVGAWDINRKRLTIFLKLNGCKTKGN